MRLQFVLLICFLLFTQFIHSNSYTVPKESYLTYTKFKQQQSFNDPTFRATDEWLELAIVPPLLAKYQVNENTVVSISSFDGSVGDDLSNVNRWRRQLGLQPIEYSELSNYLLTQSINQIPTKIIQLQNNGNFLLIYWLTIGNKHFFVKVESKAEINQSLFDQFIINQPWEDL